MWKYLVPASCALALLVAPMARAGGEKSKSENATEGATESQAKQAKAGESAGAEADSPGAKAEEGGRSKGPARGVKRPALKGRDSGKDGKAASSETEEEGAAAGEPDAAEEAPGPALEFRVTGRVVLGQAEGATHPALVDVQQVFKEIPAYQKVKKENLSRTKARYHILVNQANEEFLAAVKAVALRQGLDLVVEKGGLYTRQRIPDITESVIQQLGR